jgi:hypothetical protein
LELRAGSQKRRFHHKGTKINTKGHKEDRKQRSEDRDQKTESKGGSLREAGGVQKGNKERLQTEVKGGSLREAGGVQKGNKAVHADDLGFDSFVVSFFCLSLITDHWLLITDY